MRTAPTPPRRRGSLRRSLLASLVAAALWALASPASADSQTPRGGVWPLAPRPDVVAGFDLPSTRWGAGHRGVDLAGRAGQPVRAAALGRVSFAGTLAGRGVVVVDHGTTRSTYEPVSPSVTVGDTVAAGAMIGRLQVFGSHCFPASCLHWGLIEGRDNYLNPLSLVGAGPVRLLPLFTDLPPPRAPLAVRSAVPFPSAAGASDPATPGPRGIAALRDRRGFGMLP